MRTDVNGHFVGKVAFVTGAASGINQPAAPYATDALEGMEPLTLAGGVVAIPAP